MKWVRQRCQLAPGTRRSDRVDEPGMRVGGHQPDAGEATGDERAQEGEPGRAVLAGDDIEAERLAEAVAVDGDRVDDADVDAAAALPAFHDQGVESHDGYGPQPSGRVRKTRRVETPARYASAITDTNACSALRRG